MIVDITNAPDTRRIFLIQAAASCAALCASLPVQAQVLLAESDAQATALGYKADATKVYKAKHAKYAAGQFCNNCALYQATASSAAGGCPLFAGKQVAGKGWCSAWVKKA